jgi:murein tripeptide amidase MpaA
MARRALGLLILLAAGLRFPAAAQLRPLVVRVSGSAGIDSLARLGFEVAGVRRVIDGLEAMVVASPEMERLLVARGFVAAPPPGLPPLGAAGDSFQVYRSFDKPVTGIRATLAAWAAADTLLHVDSIGASLEGRPILAVKIGPAADSPSRPNVLFMGTHHAREWVATEMAMQLVRWLADSLPAALRDTRDIWVIPVENPDGYQYTFTTDCAEPPAADSTVGVDLNRNYPGSGATTTQDRAAWAEIYRGPSPPSSRRRRSSPSTQRAAGGRDLHTLAGWCIPTASSRRGRRR